MFLYHKSFILLISLILVQYTYTSADQNSLSKSEENALENQKTSDSKSNNQDITKKTRGYFGKTTRFYDKNGRAKLLNKDFKSMTIEELEHNRSLYQTATDLDTIIRYTERMITVCKDPDKIGKLKFELAELYFSANKFSKAGKAFREFIQTYPGSKYKEYANYKMIVAMSKLNLPSDKDQTNTKETLKAIKEFVSSANYAKYHKEIKEIIDKSNKNLIGSEINIFNIYINKQNLTAAEKRLKYIKDNFPKIDEFILGELEKQFEAAKNNKTYVPKYKITTNSTIFENNVTEREDVKPSKKSYAQRF